MYCTGGIDYGSGPFDIIFTAGKTVAVFNVTVTNDNIVEDIENFILTIDRSLLPDMVTTEDPGQTVVNIVDDDSE